MPEKSEVETIDRRKFLAELSRLLTFMYEEDRQLALSFYERMFDAAEDEQTLLHGLMSPTRQAVLIARAYDAKERRLSVSSHSKEEDGYQESEEIPPFVLVIRKVFKDIFPDDVPAQEFVEAQISLFDDRREETGSFVDEYFGTDGENKEPQTEPAPVPAVKPLQDTQEFEPVEKPAPEEADENESPEIEAEPEEVRISESREENTEGSGDLLALLTSEKKPVEKPTAMEVGPESEPENTLLKSLGLDDGFHFRRDEEPAHLNEEIPLKNETEAQDETEQKPEEAAPAAKIKTVPSRKAQQRRRREPAERKASIPLQILFWIAAVPVTLMLLALLLVLLLTAFSLSLGLIAMGGMLIISAFSGFAVLADILLLLGSALVSLAFGLLLLWIAVWIAGGVIPGLFRWVIERNRDWCYKEVPEE